MRELTIDERIELVKQFRNFDPEKVREDLYSFHFNHPAHGGPVTRSDEDEQHATLTHFGIPTKVDEDGNYEWDLSYFDRFKNMEPYFEITEDEWYYVKETYPKDLVKETLAKILMDYPIPYAEMTEKDAKESFMKLKGIRWNEVLSEGEWFPRKAAESKYPYTYDGKQLFFSRLNTGNKSSNYFQQENRWSVDGSVSPGPKRTWENHKFMTSLMGSAYSLKLEKLGKTELRTMIGLRKYICSQFKPNVAKVFYEMFDSKNILDFSMGWGDRLAGFYASNETEVYVGLDPRKENHPLYDEQKEFYEKHRGFFENEKKSEFHIAPAEDFDFTKYNNFFDTVFTSPPYFSVERYSHDDTQSWVRYKNIDVWNEEFLHTTLRNIYPTVKKGGIIAINIADIYTNSSWSTDRQWLEICNPMNDFLKSLGMTYKGCIGMEMSKRPNSGGAGTAKNDHYDDETLQKSEDTKLQRFCEPIWIWEK